MKRVFLDTNFLIDLCKFKIELERIPEVLEEQVEFFISSASMEEMKRIAKSKGKSSNLAKLALKIVKLGKITLVETKEESADKAFLSLADKNTIIATNDSSLRKKLKVLGIKTIYLRGKKKLEVG